VAVLLTGCATERQGGNVDQNLVDAVEPPDEGACRVLTLADTAEPANATVEVPCSRRHTAQTYHVALLEEQFAELDADDARVGEFALQRCGNRFRRHLGATESQAMRTTLSWVWFRPSRRAWEHGARWIRCDIIGSHIRSASLRPLQTNNEGLFAVLPDDRWLVCALGEDFAEAEKVACTQKHDWRAVATVKVGEPEDPYPGEDAVARLTDQFCESQVHAWLNYPSDFDYALTWFQQADWEAGNRLSICWARTNE
jgi:hypothetical protein